MLGPFSRFLFSTVGMHHFLYNKSTGKDKMLQGTTFHGYSIAYTDLISCMDITNQMEKTSPWYVQHFMFTVVLQF
jgi:hypothetical protein